MLQGSCHRRSGQEPYAPLLNALEDGLRHGHSSPRQLRAQLAGCAWLARLLPELAELAVATRPGYPSGRIDEVLEQLDRPERVHFFEIEPQPVASRDVRELAAAGAPLVGLVPDAVAELIRARGLYVRAAGLH